MEKIFFYLVLFIAFFFVIFIANRKKDKHRIVSYGEAQEKNFEKIFNEKLAEKLKKLGFKEVKIDKNWMHPRILLERDGLWFGSTWDWRDMYLEINLGKLYFFKDVMPRVIIQGNYDAYLKSKGIYSRRIQDFSNHEDFLKYKFDEVVSTIDEILENFNDYYAKFQNKFINVEQNKKTKRAYRDYFAHLGHLGKEMTKEDLSLIE